MIRRPPRSTQGVSSAASDVYKRQKWNLFDQMILTEPLLDSSRKSLSFWKVEIFNRPFLIRQEGSRKGTPHRTFEGNTFIDGYSDHLPVITYLIKERQ